MHKQYYIRLLKYVRPYWRAFSLSIVCMVIAGLGDPVFAELMKQLMIAFKDPHGSAVRLIPLWFMLIFAVRGVATFGVRYLLSWVANRVVADVRCELLARLLRLPTPFYDQQTTGSLVSKLTHDVSNLSEAATSVLTALIRQTVTIIGLVGYMLWLNWQLTVMSLSLFPVVGLIVQRFAKRLRRTSYAAHEAMGAMTHVAEEAIANHRIVKMYEGQCYEEARFAVEAERVRTLQVKTTIAAASTTPIVHFGTATAMAIMVYAALNQAAAGQLSPEGFLAFSTAMLMLLAPVKNLSDVNGALQRGLAAADSVFTLMDTTTEQDRGTLVLSQVLGKIEFHQLSMRYPGAETFALKSIDLTIQAGETVALVGTSGSGKTTLVNVLMRFYATDSGRILLDGHAVDDIVLNSLRHNIAVVSQDVILFNDTVANNIAYGVLRGASPADILAAAEAADVMEFVDRLPLGLDTMVGERGVLLSGGQRQRIAIARALLKQAPIVVLDEATSALDNESERHIQTALERLRTGRTTLIIAHRLSTVEHADRVVVLEAGQIIEVGRHAELLSLGQRYAALYRAGLRG